MTALDTNVLVRFLVGDDEAQARAVYERFRRAESAREVFFVPLLVVLEAVWVLESAYGRSRRDILDALSSLRSMPILEFEAEQAVQNLLDEGAKSSMDLSDILIARAAQAAGCSDGLTFDRKAARMPFFRLLA